MCMVGFIRFRADAILFAALLRILHNPLLLNSVQR